MTDAFGPSRNSTGAAARAVSVETRIPIRSDGDIVAARQSGRAQATKLGFSLSESTLIATAISELARNIVVYAGQGEVLLRSVDSSEGRGIIVIARDEGPGIADVQLALQDGFSTSRGLGLGLPGVRRMMDEFEIESQNGKGTVVKVKKWMTR